MLTFQTGHFGRVLLLRVHAAGERQGWMSKNHKLRLEPYGPVLPVCPTHPAWVLVANKRIGKRIFEITSRIGLRSFIRVEKRLEFGTDELRHRRRTGFNKKGH